VRELLVDSLLFALVVSIEPTSARDTHETSDPQPQPTDVLITAAALERAAHNCANRVHEALIVRSVPNDASKRMRRYGSAEGTPYFSAEAMQWIVARGVRHLIVDLPSVDRGNDGGRLAAHRIFWNLPAGSTSAAAAVRMNATITELAYIDDAIEDGEYLLNLQIAPFMSDAAPSRPVLLSLEPV
jgi:kynurenine formamidase